MKLLPKVSRTFAFILLGLGLIALFGTALMANWYWEAARSISIYMPTNWHEKPRAIPGWKEEQEQLRREWKVAFAPSDGVTDVFYATEGGGLQKPEAVLMWRRNGQSYVARTIKRLQGSEETEIFDLSDGQPIDADTLDRLLALKPNLDGLTGVGIAAFDEPTYTLYIRRGTEEGKYLVPGEMLDVKPSPLPGFDVNTRDFWVPTGSASQADREHVRPTGRGLGDAGNH